MLESYSLITELSQGRRFGRNFKGIRKQDGLEVSIKIVQKDLHDARALDQLRNEASFSFDSDQLPQVLDFIESEEGLILVKKWMPGIELMDFKRQLKRRQLLPFVKQFVYQFTTLLNEIHAQDILHLDIKPGNLFITGTVDDFKVGMNDFGLSIRKNQIPNRKLLFPLGYAAPELILNQLDLVDERSDQFALGVTLWQFYCEALPLTHPNPSIFTNLQLTHPLPHNSQIPKALQAILGKMCSKFQFGVPPNQLDAETLRSSLISGMADRYDSLREMNDDMQKLPDRQGYCQRISFR